MDANRWHDSRGHVDQGHGYLRLFLAVFLVVFLGGLGVPGAQALWSQTATTVATVSTGTWVDRTRPGWDMSLDVRVTQTASGGRSRTFLIEWSPKEPEDAQLVASYGRGSLAGPGISASLSGDPNSGSSQVRLTRTADGQWDGHQYRFTISPRTNGEHPKPTAVVVTLNGASAYTVHFE